MADEIFTLYKNCFSYSSKDDTTIHKIIADPYNHILTYSISEKLVGVSIINKNVIYLLCVDENHRNMGIGNKLLEDSEKYVLSKGFYEILIGAGDDYIFPGVPMNDGMHDFFKKRGYFHAWGDCGCYDMSLDLKDFNCFEYNLNDTINGITYRYANERDIDNVLLAVNEAKESFAQYYKNLKLYTKNTQTPVLIAEKNNEIVGAIMLNIGADIPDEGNVGCTVTVPKYQNKGIASTMVMIATRQLKNNNLKKASLGYTYTYILNIYGRSGYKVCMEYFMAKKLLSLTK